MTRTFILLPCIAVALGATVWFGSVGGAVICDLEVAELPRSCDGSPSGTEGGRAIVDRVRIARDDAVQKADLLEAPVRGRVVVRIMDAVGNPILSARRASLSPVEASLVGASRSGRAISRECDGEAGGPGVTVFTRLVKGRRYRAQAQTLGCTLSRDFTMFARAGQEQSVILALDAESVVLAGRVVDERRAPIADASLRFRFRSSGASGSTRLLTDGEGFFRAPLGVVRRGFARHGIANHGFELPFGMLELRCAEGATIFGMLEIGDPLHAGENDLGDVVLDRGELVVAGRLVENGASTRTRHRMALELAIEQLHRDRDGLLEQWRRVDNLVVDHLEEGGFEVRGRLPRGRVRLTVGTDHYLPVEPIEFMIGSRGVTVELVSGGVVSARVLTNARLLDHSLQLVLHPTDRLTARTLELTGRATRPTASDTLTVYEWQAVRPGTYDLALRVRGGKRPWLTIPDVRVTAGARTRDPRLDAIDLRDRLRAIRIRVLDPYGKPLERSKAVRVLLDDPAPDAELTAFDARHGVVTILTGERAVDLLISARGYRPRRIRAAATNISVRLEPFPEITLRVGQDLRGVPEGFGLLVTVVPQQSRERDRRLFRTPHECGSIEALLQPGSTMKTVAPDGSATLVVRGDGSYRAYAFLQRKGSRKPWPVKGIQPAEIDVEYGLGPNVFDVRLLRGALARTLAVIAARTGKR